MITFKAKEPTGEIINSALSPFKFPAGEAHIKREEQRELEHIEIAVVQTSSGEINNDLLSVAMWADYIAQERAAKNVAIKTVLILPYIPAARADRGAPHGAKVYAQIINSLNIDQIIVFDPHSEAAALELSAADQVRYLYPEDLFQQSHISGVFKEYTGIIAPDKGATLRADGVARALNLPLHTAEKTRDFETGKLSGFKLDGLPKDGRFLIVDDICDGGGTFKGLASALGLPKEQIDLYVSHPVFSGTAVDTLPDFFDTIYTTNSFNATTEFNADFYWHEKWDNDNITDRTPYIRFDVIRLLESKIKYS
jgi:ribose-phosphate pyrophosphokinase